MSGGVPMAATIGKLLNIEYDVLVVRKIPSPYSEEVGIGATCETGECMLIIIISSVLNYLT